MVVDVSTLYKPLQFVPGSKPERTVQQRACMAMLSPRSIADEGPGNVTRAAAWLAVLLVPKGPIFELHSSGEGLTNMDCHTALCVPCSPRGKLSFVA